MDLFLVIPQAHGEFRYVAAPDETAAQDKAIKAYGSGVRVKRFGEMVGRFVVPTSTPMPIELFHVI